MNESTQIHNHLGDPSRNSISDHFCMRIAYPLQEQYNKQTTAEVQSELLWAPHQVVCGWHKKHSGKSMTMHFNGEVYRCLRPIQDWIDADFQETN